MEEKNKHQERGQSLVIIAIAVVVLLIFAVIAVDLAYGYVHRRGDQNAADAASLAGARQLADIFNENEGNVPGAYPVDSILAAMNTYAERNGIEDTDGHQGNSVNTNVTGYFLRQDGSRASETTIDQLGFIPTESRGVEAIAKSVAPSFFGGIVGLDGLPIRADAAVVFGGPPCSDDCIFPMAVLSDTFQTAPACYNIWDGMRQTCGGGEVCSNDCETSCATNDDCDFGLCRANGKCQNNSQLDCTSNEDCVGVCETSGGGSGSSSSLGWLNWSRQGPEHSCEVVGLPNDCSEGCLEYNMTPDTCLSGQIGVQAWVAGAGGIKNSGSIRDLLDCYCFGCTHRPGLECGSLLPRPVTIIVYDVAEGNGCNQGSQPGKQQFHVVGFAKFNILGYALAQGGGNANGHDGSGCLDYGTEGNRVTGEFIEWCEGNGGDCDAVGTIIAPRVIK
jgi:hypothetical protein